MAGRKRRGLSPEDKALWERVKESAKPLHHPPVVSPATPPPPTPIARHEQPARAAPVAQTRRTVPLPSVHFDLSQDMPAGLDLPKRDARALRRGKIKPDARLDLHGMTAEAAHSALTGFVLRSYARGHRLLLVITGKGRADYHDPMGRARYGILRQSVPHWLATPPLAALVLQTGVAHQAHGGDGALYVHLRRKR